MFVWAAISWCSVGPITNLYGRFTASDYVDVFDTAGAVRSWFEEHEGELEHLPWPAKSPDLNIIEPCWLVLEIRVRNRFLLSTSLKQLEEVLQEEWYKIPLDTVQDLYEYIPRRIETSLNEKVVQHHVNKEMCICNKCFHYVVHPFYFYMVLATLRRMWNGLLYGLCALSHINIPILRFGNVIISHIQAKDKFKIFAKREI